MKTLSNFIGEIVLRDDGATHASLFLTATDVYVIVYADKKLHLLWSNRSLIEDRELHKIISIGESGDIEGLLKESVDAGFTRRDPSELISLFMEPIFYPRSFRDIMASAIKSVDVNDYTVTIRVFNYIMETGYRSAIRVLTRVSPRHAERVIAYVARTLLSFKINRVESIHVNVESERYRIVAKLSSTRFARFVANKWRLDSDLESYIASSTPLLVIDSLNDPGAVKVYGVFNGVRTEPIKNFIEDLGPTSAQVINSLAYIAAQEAMKTARRRSVSISA